MAKGKAAAPKEKSPPRKTAPPEAPEEAPIPIITDQCQTYFADMVNVQTGSEVSVLTFYHTVPNPDRNSSERFVQYAKASITVPSPVAGSVSAIIRSQFLERSRLQGVSEEDIEAVIKAAEEELNRFKQMLEAKKEDENS